MSSRHIRTLAAAAAVGLALAACTGSGENDGGSENGSPSPTVDPGPERGSVQQPADPVAVVPGADGALALAASQTFFSEAPVVVLADDADGASQLRASSVALALGAPALLDDDGAAVAEELARLGTGWVLTVGDATVPSGATDGSGTPPEGEQTDAASDVVVVPAPDEDAELATVLDLPAEDAVEVSDGHEVPSVVGLERGAFTPLEPVEDGEPDDAGGGEDGAEGDATGAGADATEDGAGDGAAGAGTDGVGDGAEGDATGAGADATDNGTGDGADGAAGDGAELPAVELPEPVAGTLALTTGAPQELLGAATAGAAGADLLVVPGGDPRATTETVTAVADGSAEHVLGLGDGFGDSETLGWRTSTAATGVELPGGGQLVFPGKRYVALYGTPSTTALGVLGEQGVEETIVRAEEHAQPYEELTQDTVVPALEIIATVASSGAGSDGNYSNELPPESLRPLVDAAGEAGQYVLLDLQPGRSSFVEQAELYAELLELPHVGLALDPEWNLGPDEQHMVAIGTVTAEEVNEVVDWLADFTRERDLPQKMLVLHQFQVRMIQTVPEVDLSRSELAVLVHADGQGAQGSKQETWRTLHEHGPDIQWWGWKNFYDEDSPMLTPEQTVDQVDPVPHFISYQ